MKTNQRFLRAGLMTLLLTATLSTGYYLGATSSGSSTVAALAGMVDTKVPTPTVFVPVGAPIPLNSLGDLKSLNATVKIDTNGVMNGKRVQGTLNATVATNGQNKTQIVVSGPLLGDIVAQVGGSAVSLFAPSQVEIYKVPEGTYVVVNGLFDVCVKPKAANSTEAVEQMSPQKLMNMFTNKEVARGTFVGNETLNGTAVKHYLIDGPTFLAAAQNSKDEALNTFGESLWSAKDADLYVSSTSGYPVSFQGSYTGNFEPLKFQGEFDVQIDVTGVNQNNQINLPSSCKNPISQ
jgi:hypothetical protein